MARRSITTVVVLLLIGLTIQADGVPRKPHPVIQNPTRVKIGPIYRTSMGDVYRQKASVLHVERPKSGYQLLPLYTTMEPNNPWDQYMNKVKIQSQQKASMKLLPYNPSQYRQGNQLASHR